MKTREVRSFREVCWAATVEWSNGRMQHALIHYTSRDLRPGFAPGIASSRPSMLDAGSDRYSRWDIAVDNLGAPVQLPKTHLQATLR